jgi:hypothetical protein
MAHDNKLRNFESKIYGPEFKFNVKTITLEL